jgi:hypothetical protein
MADVATKEMAHGLIDRLEPGQVALIVERLEQMVDPVAYSLANAPFENEEIGAEEEEAVARSRADTRPPSEESHREFLAEFGLTPDDWERMGDEPLRSHGAGR